MCVRARALLCVCIVILLSGCPAVHAYTRTLFLSTHTHDVDAHCDHILLLSYYKIKVILKLSLVCICSANQVRRCGRSGGGEEERRMMDAGTRQRTHGRKNLGTRSGNLDCEWEAPSWRSAVCKKISYVDVKKKFSDRTQGCVGGEAGEAATPAFAADDGA